MNPVIRRLGRYLTQHIDGLLLAALAALLLAGLFILYSAANANMDRVTNQLINMLVALAVMWVFANVPPHYLARLAPPAYLIGLALLIAVSQFGAVSNGARRWLDIGFTRIQPSELMKIAVPLILAWYFSRHEGALRLHHYVVAAILLVVPVALIVHQPDLGTALLIVASGFFVLFLGGLSWRVMITLALVGLGSLPLVWSMMHDYQRDRILTLFDPARDPLGAGYHTIQSMIAVGSGGLMGKGWLNGTQAHLDFLPERSTDFIFAVFSEEFGLIGNTVLMVLFVLVIARGFVITMHATTLFSRLVAGAITLTFFTYAFVNMGMVSGILPVVGVPLPLVSYGGTSLVTILLGFGILMSIETHKKLAES